MSVKRIRHVLALLLAVFATCVLATGASAQSCSVSVTPMNFGAVDVTLGAAVDVTATLTVNCNSGLLSVGVCVSLGPGTGGATNAANRFMASGANTLRYSFFTDPARTIVWGSDAWAGAGAPSSGFNIPLNLGGSGSAVRTIYGRVYGVQPTVPAGSYASAFSGLDASIRYGALSFLLGCNLLTITSTTSFNVNATVPPTCRVTASNLNFGNVGVLASNHDASTNLAPVCTNGVPYIISLNGGLSGVTNPTQRRMTKGGEFVLYGLYRDAARSLPFGQTTGVDTLAGSGTGLTQSIPVFGRVAPQATPSTGLYSDTIVATVTY